MLKRINLECMGREPSEVVELNIDNCRSTGEPEGLTDNFTSLAKLSMVNAGLTTLKGFPNLAALQKLELSDNRISGTLSCLKGCTSLKFLNLSGNKIATTEALEALAELENLSQLDLSNCEVTKLPGYREAVFKLLPGLMYLDGFDQDDEEAIDSEDEEEEAAENGHEESNGATADDDDDDEDNDEDGDEEQAVDENDDSKADGDVEEGSGEDSEEDEEGDDDDDEEEEEVVYGLEYLDGDDIQDEEDDDDYQEGEEQEDEDIDEEDEDAAGEGQRGVKRKHEDEENV